MRGAAAFPFAPDLALKGTRLIASLLLIWQNDRQHHLPPEGGHGAAPSQLVVRDSTLRGLRCSTPHHARRANRSRQGSRRYRRRTPTTRCGVEGPDWRQTRGRAKRRRWRLGGSASRVRGWKRAPERPPVWWRARHSPTTSWPEPAESGRLP